MCGSAVIIKQQNLSFFGDIKDEFRCTLLVRCITGTFAFVTFSMAVKYLPLGIFFIVFNASPFITVFLSYFWIGDRILAFEGIAMIGAFAGIILLGMAKPEVQDDEEFIKNKEDWSEFELNHAYQIGLVLACISCVS